ncbi:MAG: hypothetical protein ACYCT2_06930, partial [Thermoplasmataceae archaeon]
MDRFLMDRLEIFRFHRSLNLDLLNSLDQSELGVSPINNAGSFGKQFRHIMDVQKCYIRLSASVESWRQTTVSFRTTMGFHIFVPYELSGLYLFLIQKM